MRKSKIRASSLPAPPTIKASELPPARVSISFRHLQTNHQKFVFTHKNSDYFRRLLDRLKVVCGLTWKEMNSSHKEALRCHSHDWGRTSEPKGFGLTGQLSDCQGWQFQLSEHANGRIHGFFLDDVFYVIWLDPDHRLYN